MHDGIDQPMIIIDQQVWLLIVIAEQLMAG
jgi:hypothetical protein